MNKLYSLLLLGCLSGTLALGQGDVRTRGAGADAPPAQQTTRKISGRVVDASGQPLQGATVSIVDPASSKTISGGYTDADGNFSVNAPSGTAYSIRISYVGFSDYTAKLAAEGAQTLNINLATDDTVLGEQVITGYGTQNTRFITGAQASVKGESIANIPVVSLDQAIQGRVPGLQVTSTSGKVGQSVYMRIRGPKSITAGNQPLIVVDGVIINQEITNTTTLNTEPLNPLNDFGPNDIEDIQVLKDAQATAIYGSRGANGVLLITTKRGKAGKAVTTIDYSYGTQNPSNYRRFLGQSEYITLLNEAYRNTQTSPSGPWFGATIGLGLVGSTTPSANRRYIDGTNVDWQRQTLLEDRPINNLTVSTRGGSDATQYSLSFNLFEQKGILIGNRINRVNGRVTVDHRISDKFKVGANFLISRVLTERQADDNAFSNPLQSVAFAPVDEVFNPDGTLRSASRVTGYPNPLLVLENAFAVTTTLRTLGSIYVQANILKDLTWKADLGIDILDLREEGWRGYRMVSFTGIPDGSATASGDRTYNYQTNTYVNWTPSILGADHKLDVTAGFAFQYGQREFELVQGEGLPVGDKFRYLNSASRFTRASSGVTGYRFDSYFGRANYRWRDKLLLGASIRVDGSSRFGANNRYGTFYGVSAGYILTEESFLKGNKVISLLKPRISYGKTGNAEIGNFAARSLVSPTTYKDAPGVTFNQLGDTDLKWESTKKLDIAVDFGFLEDRITGTIDYFTEKTTDLLLAVQLPAQSGFTSALRNVGSMENKGFEFSLNGKILVGELKWDAGFNITSVANTVLNSGKNADGTDARVFVGSDVQSVAQVGDAIGSFVGARFFGVDPANGDVLYYRDANTLTNDISLAQRQVIGNPNPRYTGGVTNNLSWKGFDFSMFWQFAMGHDVFNNGGQFMTAGFGGGRDNQTADALQRWTTPGQNTAVPKSYLFGLGSAFDTENGSISSSRHIQDASYWRLKTITIGYTLPQSITQKFYVQKLRVYVSAQNLLTITQFQGWDPEVNATYNATSNQNVNLIQGWDFYTVPQPKTLTFGVTVTL
jgi:TonB-linked SusC/RagA family outer membrane protein